MIPCSSPRFAARLLAAALLLLATLATAAPADAPALLQQGATLETQKKYDEAVAVYTELVNQFPLEGSPYVKRGWCYYLLGKKAKAIADLEMGVTLADADPNSYYYRGLCLKGEGEFAKAAADFAQTAKLQPGLARVAYELAFCLLKAGKPAEALEAADECDRLKPDQVKTLALRSAIHEKAGHAALALADCDRALAACKDEKQRPAIEQARVRLAAAQPAVFADTVAPTDAAPSVSPAAGATRLDISQLSAAQYNGAVSVAMEGMRLVHSPLSPAETKKFEAKWAPMFHHPSAENIAYLNRLNPLAQEWLALRSQLAETAAAYDKTLEEAHFAATYGSGPGTRTAVAEAGSLLTVLQEGRIHLTDLASQLQAIGDPPDAVAGHRKRKAAHAEAIKVARHAAGLPDEEVYLKLDFSRQPEGWVHELSAVGSEQWHPSVAATLLPVDQRYAYIRPNDSRIAKMSGLYPDLDPRQYCYTDPAAWVEFSYRGSDLLTLGSIVIRVQLAHAPLVRAEDLAVHLPDGAKPSYGTGSAAGCRGPMVVLADDNSRSERFAPEYSVMQLMALDNAMGGDDYRVVVRVLADCRNPAPSANAPAEESLWKERSAILRARIEARVQSLLDHLEFQFVKEVPKSEPQRLKALQEYAEANPLRPLSSADEERLADWRHGCWTLRHGADPVPSLPQDVQSGNAGYTRFDDGKTVFLHTWTRPPAQLQAGSTLEFELVTENTKQDVTPLGDGKTAIASRSAYTSANWDNIADTRYGRFFGIETARANSNPGDGEQRTSTRTKIPICFPWPGNYSANVEIRFTQPGGSIYAQCGVIYTYDWAWTLGPDNPSIPPSVLPSNLSSVPDLPPPSAEEMAKAEAEKKWKKERIAEIQQNIVFLNQCLSRESEALGRASGTTERGTCEFRLLGLNSDIQAEMDLIRSLETGEIVHTRSPFDNYAAAHFQQQCQTEAREASQMVRAVAAANRLAAMLPPGEAEKTRAFIGRQFTPKVVGGHDVATARQALQAVKNTVQGHFEGVAAQGAGEAAEAQFGLEAAENIKTAADTGMSACSLFGGQSVNLIYQAGTGYIEGGPGQGLKAAATTWSDTIDYAVTAYDAYKQGGASDAALAAGWKFAQNKTMGYVAGKIMGGGGHGSSDPDHPLYKPTLQEQFDAAKFKQERGWGEGLVKDFQKAQTDLQRAGGSGATPEALVKLQAAARDKAAAVASSLHAKNYLKYVADAGTGRAYDAHMGAVHAESDALLKQKMKAAGWNTEEWELTEFRNAASLGKPNMDRDVGLRERGLWLLDEHGVPMKGVRNPDAWATGPNGRPTPKPQLTKDGKPMTLDAWRDEAETFYNQAYRKASGGRSSTIAMEGITTSTHPEAYKDLLWLGQDKTLVSQAWAGQAADVTRYKANHLLAKGDPSAAYFTKLQEVSRGTAKDMETKLLPLLNAAKPSAGGTGLRSQASVSAEALARSRVHWSEVNKTLQAFGRNDMDPITTTRRIRELTGGKSIPEVVDEMATLLESLAKGGR